MGASIAATVAGPEIKATGQVNQDSKSAELVALTNDWTDAINKKDRSKLEALTWAASVGTISKILK